MFSLLWANEWTHSLSAIIFTLDAESSLPEAPIYEKENNSLYYYLPIIPSFPVSWIIVFLFRFFGWLVGWLVGGLFLPSHAGCAINAKTTCRLVCAFSYYGIVLLTTALFENPDGCHGELYMDFFYFGPTFRTLIQAPFYCPQRCWRSAWKMTIIIMKICVVCNTKYHTCW